MNDDVKAAVEALRRAARNSNAPELWHDEHLILAHIDGEPARTAAAVAAAREETVAACYRAMTHPYGAHAALEAAHAEALDALGALADLVEPDACSDCSCEGSNPACHPLGIAEAVLAKAGRR